MTEWEREKGSVDMSSSPEWIKKSAVYHIYPLGFCGCERTRAEYDGKHEHRIRKVLDWIQHLKAMHLSAVYFGPVFESAAHGYDTSDYRLIDARLGTNEDFSDVCRALHENGIRVVLDGVFNHVGREHFKSFYCLWSYER